MSLKESEKKEVIAAFGSGEDNFYVYALCEIKEGKKIPFYIGKGCGARVWQHETEADNKTEAISKAIEDYFDPNENPSSDEINKIRRDFEDEINAKIKKIEDVKTNSTLELVIIKWGLTEAEAFMAESALINFIGLDNLTNIVNGHASDKEKNSNNHGSLAMSVEEFYGTCCKEPINFDNIKEKWLFININKLYNDAYTDEKISDITRGCWATSCEPEYVFAVYRSRIVGIFKRKRTIKLNELFTEQEASQLEHVDIESFDLADYPVFAENEFPSFPDKGRKEDMIKLINHYASNETADEWLKRVYFVFDKKKVDKLKLIDGTEISANDLIGRSVLLGGTESAFVQNPVRTPDLNIYYQNDSNKGKRKVVNKSSFMTELSKHFLSVNMHTWGSLRDKDDELTTNGKNLLNRMDVIVRSRDEELKDKDMINVEEIVFDPQTTTAEVLAQRVFEYIKSSRKPLITDVN